MTGLLTSIYGLGWVPTVLWILLAWGVAAVLVGLAVGAVVRRRDMQVPSLPPSTDLVEDGEQEWTTRSS